MSLNQHKLAKLRTFFRNVLIGTGLMLAILCGGFLLGFASGNSSKVPPVEFLLFMCLWGGIITGVALTLIQSRNHG
jgi:RsiW-degrading membrane proteinase PrsW (M82 family)